MTTTSTHTVPWATVRHIRSERSFFTWVAIAMLAVSATGFLPSLIDTSGRRGPMSPLVGVHSGLFFAWLVIFLAQARLIATGRVRPHRRLGIVAAIVLPFMVATGYLATVHMVRRGFDLSGDLARTLADPVSESIFQFGDLILFSILAAAALVARRHADFHRRFMLFANISLMGAPLAHLAGHVPRFLPFIVAIVQIPLGTFLTVAVVRDVLLTRRLRPLTLTLAIVIFSSPPFWLNVVGPSVAWHRFAVWLVR